MSTLGNFETRLLAELRRTVAEAGPAPAGSPGPRRRRVALAAAGGGVLAAGVMVGVPMLGDEQAPAAYAVQPNEDGTVTVSISRWEDADGLERQLEANGVAAEVDYAPAGKACRWPRYEIHPLPLGGFLVSWAVDGNRASFTLRPADLTGRTLVITHYQDPRAQLITSVAGPVAPCELVDAKESGDPIIELNESSGPTAPPSTR